MITIDPYEMHPRYTYDIRKWMGINETLTAVFYDYRSSEYHIFLAHNKYYKWTVNVTFMNRLPMSWVRQEKSNKKNESDVKIIFRIVHSFTAL